VGGGLIDEKTEGRKSRDTVPLRIFYGNSVFKILAYINLFPNL
jgi:hypothetical protein